MTSPSTLAIEQDYAWLIAIPKRDEFTQPQFHFGERVKWSGEDTQGVWSRKTGRIIGLKFTHDSQWHYSIHLDTEFLPSEAIAEEVWIAEAELKLVPDSASVRKQLKPESEWMTTQQAAQVLGISAEQLRKLRRRQLFKIGYHYRDTSVPGSGLPHWQWHIERCGKALEMPPEKRSSRTK
ncbi:MULTISPECIES: helix-turn-helix domain-containing protein [Trichocoleus]|uniref:Helix-turn-helix domain-containing protein n=1 Tax=Trichocoleus desertorum GB2-A4 TaxID=2933944 RepID=A0ABV0JGV2_9CYAN|nr:helix-turn-helix domain-containing protein [Trichocoleus sp. FACHB-46]